MRVVRYFAFAAAFLAWLLGFAPEPEYALASAPPDVVVREGGTHTLTRYTTRGAVLQRYAGFSPISAVRVYDGQTVLVAEESRDSVSALTLDGRILWEIPIHRPRSIQVLGIDRFLVSLDDPPSVLEVDRTGRELWRLDSPLPDAAGAVRLADGNTAVVQGRVRHAVDVFSPAGRLLWSGTRELKQPRGLALMPSGEIVTSGFDTGQLVIFQPYSDSSRSLGFHGHVVDVSVTMAGNVMSFSPELQLVRAWNASGGILWQFETLYPPWHGDMLPDGTVLIDVYEQPDNQCLNAARMAERSRRPVAPYWMWLAAGLVSAAVLTTFARRYAARRWIGEESIGENSERPATPPNTTPDSVRRAETALYALGAIVLAATAAMRQFELFTTHHVWWYVALIGLAGLLVAAIQYRLPVGDDDWTRRMARLRPMQSTTRLTWTLWTLGVLSVGASLYGVWRDTAGWPAAAWSAGLILLLGGALEVWPAGQRKIRVGQFLLGLLSLGVLLFVRVYRLEEYPANLHLDMAQWSTQTFRLLDGEARTIFGNGWAEIPLLGYVWSAFWTAVAGRSLAGVRFASVAGSLLAIIGVYFLTRRLFSNRAAVMASVLLGVHHGFLHFSRIQAYMDPILFHTLGLLGLIAGMESGRYGWFALAGLAGGYSALTYHAGRVTPLVMIGLAGLIVLRYPSALAKRWSGLILCLVSGTAMLAPQALLFATGAAHPFGRGDMYPWMATGRLETDVLQKTLASGLPRAFGTFWWYPDSSTQYGGFSPVFVPALAALLGMGVVAAMLHVRDIRGISLVLWGFGVLFIGGALTRDPPFWPRIVISFIPTTVLVATVLDWLYRGARAALGRAGRAFAFAGLVAFVGLVAFQNVRLYLKYTLGIPPDGTQVTIGTQWPQGVMGRDLQRWGQDALIYIVARSHIDHSCQHPTMQYYAYYADVCDAREINRYLPFPDRRTIVCYFLPEMTDQIAAVRNMYQNAQEKPFFNNLGQHVFTRVVIPRPHA